MKLIPHSSKLNQETSSSLDSYKHNRNRGCGKWSLKGRLNEQGYEEIRYIRLGCKKWTCERCGPRKARRVRHAIKAKAVDYNLKRFLTLTLDPRYCSPDDSMNYVRKCFNKFRTYLRRRYKGTISYITIVELQNSGYAHLHILIDRFIEQSWISGAWQAVGGGKIVFITQVDLHRVAPYLSKYLTKDLLLGESAKKYRRYTTSRNIRLFLKSTTGEWTVVKCPLEILLKLFEGHFWEKEHDEAGILKMLFMKIKIGMTI